jgi:hypothetical protein
VVARPLVLGEAVRDVRRLQLAEHLADGAAGTRRAVHGGVDLEDAVERVGGGAPTKRVSETISPARRPHATTIAASPSRPAVGSG